MTITSIVHAKARFIFSVAYSTNTSRFSILRQCYLIYPDICMVFIPIYIIYVSYLSRYMGDVYPDIWMVVIRFIDDIYPDICMVFIPICGWCLSRYMNGSYPIYRWYLSRYMYGIYPDMWVIFIPIYMDGIYSDIWMTFIPIYGWYLSSHSW